MGLFKKKEKPEMNINGDTTLMEVLAINKKMPKVLMGFGMHCFGCPMAQQETLKEAAQVHGIDLELMIKKIKENI